MMTTTQRVTSRPSGHWTCHECGKDVLGANLEHCTVCHETFGGTQSGDKHRTGAHGTPERRCLTPEEILARGLVRGKRGAWVFGNRPIQPADTRSVLRRTYGAA